MSSEQLELRALDDGKPLLLCELRECTATQMSPAHTR